MKWKCDWVMGSQEFLENPNSVSGWHKSEPKPPTNIEKIKEKVYQARCELDENSINMDAIKRVLDEVLATLQRPDKIKFALEILCDEHPKDCTCENCIKLRVYTKPVCKMCEEQGNQDACPDC